MNDDGNFRNGGHVGNFRNVRNVENIRRYRETSSVIHFRNHKLKLIRMMMAILRMVGEFQNVRNVENVRRDRQTFSEPQAQGDLNDDGNFRNGWDF